MWYEFRKKRRKHVRCVCVFITAVPISGWYEIKKNGISSYHTPLLSMKIVSYCLYTISYQNSMKFLMFFPDVTVRTHERELHCTDGALTTQMTNPGLPTHAATLSAIADVVFVSLETQCVSVCPLKQKPHGVHPLPACALNRAYTGKQLL